MVGPAGEEKKKPIRFIGGRPLNSSRELVMNSPIVSLFEDKDFIASARLLYPR